MLRAEPELPRSRLRGARAAQGTVRVRRALLRAEPELPRSRLRGARAAQGTVRVKITEAKRLGRRDHSAWNTLWILK
ncbi:hypothetical protein NDU88_002010 [Pleurodeles waltl]|uniref:Uncharacterized protein n=1 Tax=Pleurodeles waltl TaxID=8319 RepID=A0AAV7NCE3_PLEWA|nr:hypothetical protein NDU88_002010 [Pleurodeles waltl]